MDTTIRKPISREINDFGRIIPMRQENNMSIGKIPSLLDEKPSPRVQRIVDTAQEYQRHGEWDKAADAWKEASRKATSDGTGRLALTYDNRAYMAILEGLTRLPLSPQ